MSTSTLTVPVARPETLRSFRFEQKPLRVMERPGGLWFVAADACSVLGIGNSRMAVARLDMDEKDVSSADTPGGPQQLSIISESGLYTLILRSRGATTPGTPAHRFRKWVTQVVLPTIRRTGRYASVAKLPIPNVRAGSGKRILVSVRLEQHWHGEDAMQVAFTEDGQPWFVAADISWILDRKQFGAGKMTDRMPLEGKALCVGEGVGLHRKIVLNAQGIEWLLTHRGDAVIPGSNAWKFRQWLNDEVFPAVYPVPSQSAAPAKRDVVTARKHELKIVVEKHEKLMRGILAELRSLMARVA